MGNRFKEVLSIAGVAQRAFSRDVALRAQYGVLAPRYAERIHVKVDHNVLSIGHFKQLCGQVVDKWPPQPCGKISRVVDSEPYLSCSKHWLDGVRWEDTPLIEKAMQGIRQHGRRDDCKSREDVLERYERLDAVFAQAKKNNGLLTRQEISWLSFREWNGVGFHIGPEGEVLFGRVGQHRLAIALLLGFEAIPAMLGAIHVDALPLLAEFRRG